MQNAMSSWMAFWSPYYNHNHLYQPLLTRSKRALENPTAEDMKKFSEDVAMFKEHKRGMIGNLTCVLAKMGKLNANLGKQNVCYWQSFDFYFIIHFIKLIKCMK